MVKTKGTGEWSEKNLNIQGGCFNNCPYCYAYRMAKRYKRVKNRDEWKAFPEIKIDKIHKGYRKLKRPDSNLYDYMFPTSHDIFPENLYYCIKVLKKILEAGNSVLITTKPTYYCIKQLVKELEAYKDQICFRFTITSWYQDTLDIFEPEAPNIENRKKSLILAFENGYKTSISIEPFLDPSPHTVINCLETWVNDTIWVGIMSGIHILEDLIPEQEINKLKSYYSRENLFKIYNELKQTLNFIRAKIRFKDSFVNKLNLKRNYYPDKDFEPQKTITKFMEG